MQPRKSDNRRRMRALEQRIWDIVRKRAPESEEAREFAKKFSAWSARSVAVARDATKLTAAGRAREAKELLDGHYEARPRRRPGRPSKTLPRAAQITGELSDRLITIALDVCEKDSRLLSSLLEETASRALQRALER